MNGVFLSFFSCHCTLLHSIHSFIRIFISIHSFIHSTKIIFTKYHHYYYLWLLLQFLVRACVKFDVIYVRMCICMHFLLFHLLLILNRIWYCCVPQSHFRFCQCKREPFISKWFFSTSFTPFSLFCRPLCGLFVRSWFLFNENWFYLYRPNQCSEPKTYKW